MSEKQELIQKMLEMLLNIGIIKDLKKETGVVGLDMIF